MASVKELLEKSLYELEKAELKKFQWHLRNDHESISKSDMENADRLKTVDKMVECFGPEKAVKITVEILRKMNQNNLAEHLENKHKQGSSADDRQATLHDYTETILKLKNKLKQDYKRILVGNSQTGHQKNLNDIYTDLYMVENETGGRVNDHEVIQIGFNHKQYDAKDTPIQCNNIFKVNENKKVLTMGIAGVGKTVSVNKFILDWAEGTENHDIALIFPLPFRQLNLITENCSLMGLIHKHFFNDSKELPSFPEDDGKVLFIFDGLDECRFTLNFKEGDRITDVHKKTTVSKIITNLIKTDLLPSAFIWITSRPAAATLIPRNYINQVTEVRGFNDEQKEQYFIKNSSSEVSGNIIRHIRKSRSLYIMCHIPVFCWISLTVLQPLLARESNDKTPTTLTEMYTNFLISQQQQMEEKYSDEPEANAMHFDQIILKLGKLAFQQLEEGKLIFYKEDLEECGLDVSEGSVYSGLCTQIFQEEKAVSARSVYSFVHLSIQEFLAALYVFLISKDKKENPFLQSWTEKLQWILSQKPLFQLHKAAVNKALQSENGHLDLFLRFLLGLSLKSNQNDLIELLPGLELETENLKNTADFIKKKIQEEKSVERTFNLFHCLSELKDNFVEEIQKNLQTGNLSAQKLSSAQWSGLAFMLLMSEETQEMFELQKYRRSDEAVMRLLPVIKNTRRALLHSCDLTALSCESLSSALQSSNSVLRELDLSNNDLQDSGVKLLSDGLKSPNCHLEILRLSGCMVTEKGCHYVSSALSLNPTHLRELDLSYNHPGDSGVKLLSEKLDDPNCTLDKLNVDHGGEIRITPVPRRYSHQFTLDLNTVNEHLRLSQRNSVITYTKTELQSYPDHPDRFDVYQALCRESVSDRHCYWEIEWSGHVFISVSYKSISRKGWGNECLFGRNVQSWSLEGSRSSYSFRHNDIRTYLPVKSIISRTGVNEEDYYRVGVYVDHSAGTLSFYSVSGDTMSLIHTVQTTFTQPLYPGFRVYGSVRLC
ncbi:NACHT, LRR and PYD domains-containing protein 12-like isoform X2 [Ctenopharyngodon idella]|uniref:NACHT, LRR and PYD domains-containing protein 12-like isoform X2 n=1 Tax=Ctenopharyngodon idella TaxID=7959 RepID=UPI002230560B|nr:NACHT, LRR and PYD domains-containing protein 12-like isoform X2 [Ctenopharyngodon idella]